MTTESIREIKTSRRRLEIARVLVGTAVIVAALWVVLSGFGALRQEKDAWLAMRGPIATVMILSVIFARIAKAVVTLQRGSRR